MVRDTRVYYSSQLLRTLVPKTLRMRIIASDFVRNEAAALGGRMLRRAFGAA